MENINEIVEHLAATVVNAEATDLRALTELHDHFHKLRESAGTELPGATSAAATAEQILTRVIFREEPDVDAALEQLGSLVAEIQQVVNFVGKSTPVAEEVADDALRADDLPLVVEFVTEAREHLEAAEAEVLKLDGEANSESVNAIFRSFHTIKGVAGFLNLKEIGLLAHSAENLLDLARKGQLVLDGRAAGLILESIDAGKSMLGTIETSAQRNVPLAKYDGLPDLRARLDACAAGVKLPVAGDAKSQPTAEKTVPAAGSTPSVRSHDSTVKVATDRLDSLISMVGELVITQSMVRQESRANAGVTQRLTRNLGRLDKITRELQDLSMSMRMVPIQGVFQKMVRLVHDLSEKFGKQMDLVIVGGDTELDRNVVEAIADPLMHMVRNAADHGIDTPEERAKAGKSPVGRIELKACHRAGQIVIEISDDGKGLNKQRILKKAHDAGILQDGDKPSDADIFRLIFHAGLSTAEKVTDVSGRGVGMDVVKKNVEALRGRIDITSVEGAGSTFTICLPLTLAVIDGLVVRVGDQRYIIPLLSIEQSIRPVESQLSTVQGRGELCMIRGRALRLLRLHRLFNVTPISEDPTKALVVIVQDNGREACLLVDELLGQQQVVIKSLGDGIGAIRGISGGAILGDGTVSLILDIPGVIDLATKNAAKEAVHVA
ncbi:MAG TPA: chemotaxis protein CheA [Tepidisphaeraceae bacterium]|jgi:two-component system chemotaxis sensor kinase CheA|nr:chemotaxis protein CheA [Tepidisphaeraceae bacterium]